MSHTLSNASSDSTTNENQTSTSSPTPPSFISAIKVTTNDVSPLNSIQSDMGKLVYRKPSFSLHMFSKHSSVMIEELVHDDDAFYFDDGKSESVMNNALDILRRLSLTNKLKLDPVIGLIKTSSPFLEMSSVEEIEEFVTPNIKVKKNSSADERENNFFEIVQISTLNAVANIVILDSVNELVDVWEVNSSDSICIPRLDLSKYKDMNSSLGMDNSESPFVKLENEKEKVDLYLKEISLFSQDKCAEERFQKTATVLITESELEFLVQLKDEEEVIGVLENYMESFLSSQMEMSYFEYIPRKTNHGQMLEMPDILETTALDFGIGANYLNYYKQEYCEGKERFSVLLKRDEILQDIIHKQCYEVQDSLTFSHSFIRSVLLYRKKKNKRFTRCLKIYSPDKNLPTKRNANSFNPQFTRMRPICLNSLTQCVVRDKHKDKSTNRVLLSNKNKSNKRFY